jgi:hypothetical protein
MLHIQVHNAISTKENHSILKQSCKTELLSNSGILPTWIWIDFLEPFKLKLCTRLVKFSTFYGEELSGSHHRWGDMDRERSEWWIAQRHRYSSNQEHFFHTVFWSIFQNVSNVRKGVFIGFNSQGQNGSTDLQLYTSTKLKIVNCWLYSPMQKEQNLYFSILWKNFI